MRARERLLAALTQRETDRVSWAPQTTRTFFLGIEEYGRRFRSAELTGPIDPYLVPEELAYRVAWYRNRGMDFIDWLPPPLTMSSHRVRLRDRSEGSRRHREIETPVGALESIEEYSESAKAPHPVSYLLKGPDDFRAYEYFLEDLTYEPRETEVKERLRIIGDDGVALFFGPNSAVQQLLLGDLGIEATIFCVHDHRAALGRLIDVVHRTNLQMCGVMARSAAEVFVSGNVTGTGMISPWIYRELVVPYISEYARLLRDARKVVVSHASGEPIGAIAGDILATGVCGIHGLALASPQESISLAVQWAGRVTAWGGFDPAFLARARPQEAAARTQSLLDDWPGGFPLILGSSDDCVEGTAEDVFTVIAAEAARRRLASPRRPAPA